MEKFKLGKSKKEVMMPSGWHEIPFYQGVKISEDNLNEVETLALLSNCDVEDIRSATDPESIFYLLSAFRFLREMPLGLDKPQIPNSIKFNGHHIIFPHVIYQDIFDLGKASVGQIKDMEMVMVNMGTEFRKDEEEENQDRAFTELETIKMCPSLCAIYIQKLIDKEYDYDTAMKLSSEIEQHLSFKEVLNIGYFFLKRLADLNDGQTKSYRKSPSIIKRFKQVLTNLIRRMASTPH